jgi:hypothetical protein
MRIVSPSSGSSTVGTAESGARSIDDRVRCSPGLACTPGGEEDRIPVVEVGIGVGYLCRTGSIRHGDVRTLLLVRPGRQGEEEKGSKAGSKVGAGRFVPAIFGKVG